MTNKKHRQSLMDTFVNAVFVHDDKMLLTFNFQDGTRTITLTDVQTAAGESGLDLEMFGAPNKKDRAHLNANLRQMAGNITFRGMQKC